MYNFAFLSNRFSGFIEVDEDLPDNASLNVSFFLNEIRGESEEFVHKSLKWAIRQQGYHFKSLISVFMMTSTQIGSINENTRLAMILSDVFGMQFDVQVSVLHTEFFAKIILAKQHDIRNPETENKIVILAAMLSEFYKLGWIDDDDAYLHCMTLSVSNKFGISLRQAAIRALVEAAMENLQKNYLDERFLFILEKFEFEVDLNPDVFHQLYIMTPADVAIIRKLLVSIGFVTAQAAACRSITSITNLIRQYTARNAKKTLKQFELMGLKHSDQFDFVTKVIFKAAQDDYHQSERYAEVCMHLMNGPCKHHQEKFLAAILKFVQVSLSIHVSEEFDHETIDKKINFTTFLGFMYNADVFNDEVITEVIAILLEASKKQEQLSLCLSELMKCIGLKYEKNQRSSVDDLFKHIAENASFETGAVRAYTFKRLIEYRNNGWEDLNARQRRHLYKQVVEEMKGPREKQEQQPIEDSVNEDTVQELQSNEFDVADIICKKTIHEILENSRLMESEETVQALKSFLQNSECRVKIFIDIVLKHQNSSLKNASMSLELLIKISKVLGESPIDFQKIVVNQINLQILQLGRPKSLNEVTRMLFPRLTVITAELFELGILSNKKFLIIIQSKGITRLSVDVLIHLSAKIYTRIRLEGNKRLKAALVSLENLITKSRKTIFTCIQNDLNDLSLELDDLIKYEGSLV